MTDNSPEFHRIVAKSFQEIVSGLAVFIAAVDDLYDRYLAAFPEGTNPIFRKRPEHDCATCRHFIRRAGNVTDGTRTVWDEAGKEAPYPYNIVAAQLRDAVLAAGIGGIFRVKENETSFGAKQTHSMDGDKALTWNHLHTGVIPNRLRVSSPDAVRGDYRTTVQVFERGLVELTADAVDTVLSLIESNALYRGEEHKAAVLAFRGCQTGYQNSHNKTLFAWLNAASPAARFRNTVIGTLVQDLSEGKDLEHAVKSFETKVAPTNYKRTTALITPGMVKKAMETISELGLEPALERRFATIADISVNDVKWVDGAVRSLMNGGIGEVLMKHAAQPVTEERSETISLDDFMTRVLPETTGLELLFKGELVGNLMSLTAPVHPEPKQLFRWNNDFAWSYGGNVADSIKERVKKAGGRVDGAVLRVSLSWFNYDDLDLHIIEPQGRGVAVTNHIYFGAKRGWTGGELDVDMNAGGHRSREAVENVHWTRPPPDGAYRVVVHNYTQRETNDPGFVVEVEGGGRLTHFTYNKMVRNMEEIAVALLYMKAGAIDRIEPGDPGITSGTVSQEKWGLTTEQYAKVTAVTLSPNYWGDNRVGNRHTFFVLDGAKNDEATRGFYNEFLHPRLEPHRKVFEVIGDKTKCVPTDGQLSGLGFSSTKPASFIVRAQQGGKRRVFNVQVGGQS